MLHNRLTGIYSQSDHTIVHGYHFISNVSGVLSNATCGAKQVYSHCDLTVDISFCFFSLRKQVMLEHEQNMIALNDHLQMTRLRQQKRFVNPLLSRNSDMSVAGCVPVLTEIMY